MPNVLLLMCDEMSAWGVGASGDPRPVTPVLDALARRGCWYDAAYTPSPICVPTRAAIACGRYLHEIGYWSSAEPYDGAAPSWGHRLQAAGVRVVSIGKLHYRNRTDDTGFDRQIEPIHVVDGKGWVQGLLRKPLCAYDATAELAEEIGPGNTAYLDFDRRVTDEACRWLAEPDRARRPWCAFVSWLSPHYPLIAPPEFYARFDPQTFESEAEDVPDHPVLGQIAGFFDHDPYFTPETRGIARAAYFALCAFVDAQVGRVLAALGASGQADDTLVIFTSDHGEMLGAKGFWTKSTMYDDAARVPLIAAGPGVAPGRWDAPVSLIDLAPTICAAVDAEAAGFPGRVLLDPDPARAVLSEYHDGGSPVGITMLRWTDATGAWKYVHYAEGQPPQLFELAADPDERTDLAARRPDVLAAARDRLFAMLDPEEVNVRALAAQARRVEDLGGRDALEALPVFNYTPADSG